MIVNEYAKQQRFKTNNYSNSKTKFITSRTDHFWFIDTYCRFKPYVEKQNKKNLFKVVWVCVQIDMLFVLSSL